MKLRIRENSVRLRLTQSEVAELAESGLVENKTDFGSGQVFVYSVSASDSSNRLKATFEGGHIGIIVPTMTANRWAGTEEVGIEGMDGTLNIMIEKDFACLTVREGEDESDAFPNPKENEINC